MRFFLEVTQHIPPRGLQYIRRYGLYASRTKGKWPDMPHVVRLAPAGWKAERLKASKSIQSSNEKAAVPDQESSRTWARLIAQVYEVDPLTCSRCCSPMRILAVITEPEEVKKILRHLVKVGRPPAGIPAQAGAGSKLRVIANLFTCLLRGMSMSLQRPLGLQTAVFFHRIARSSSRRVILSGNQLCRTEDEQESSADRLDGCYIRGLDGLPRIMDFTIN